jgi:hypothetical protein
MMISLVIVRMLLVRRPLVMMLRRFGLTLVVGGRAWTRMRHVRLVGWMLCCRSGMPPWGIGAPRGYGAVLGESRRVRRRGNGGSAMIDGR